VFSNLQPKHATDYFDMCPWRLTFLWFCSYL